MMPDQTGARWRKSTRSGAGNDCVEVATNLLPATGRVLIRDSKHPHDATLSVDPHAWRAFLHGTRHAPLAPS